MLNYLLHSRVTLRSSAVRGKFSLRRNERNASRRGTGGFTDPLGIKPSLGKFPQFV